MSIFFHAHPDDEALLTSGSMAALAAAGGRVVLVLATGGGAGLAAASYGVDGTLADRRLAEARRSAGILGVSRVELLGYRDSGLGAVPAGGRVVAMEAGGGVRGADGADGEVSVPDPAPPLFADADVDEAAGRLAAILDEEGASILTTYDVAGGYGHPDHRQVHVVGARAAALAGTPLVLEATLPREPLARAVRWADRWLPLPAGFRAEDWQGAYTPAREITDRVDVRRFLRQRRASMRAHASQASADGGLRTLAVATRLPPPLFGALFGREYYRRSGVSTRPADQLPAALRGG